MKSSDRKCTISSNSGGIVPDTWKRQFILHSNGCGIFLFVVLIRDFLGTQLQLTGHIECKSLFLVLVFFFVGYE